MKLIDLTQKWTETMSNYPGDPQFCQQLGAEIEQDGYQLTRYQLHSHLGTHLDTPAHLFLNGKTTADYPLEHFFGRAYCAQLPQEHEVEQWLAEHAKAVKQAEIVLLRTGWSKYFSQASYFTGYPVLPKKLAFWLSQQNLKLIGIDTPSFDNLGEACLQNHQYLLKADILLVENLKNLEYVPSWSQFCAFPFPVAGDGSPVRAVCFEKTIRKEWETDANS